MQHIVLHYSLVLQFIRCLSFGLEYGYRTFCYPFSFTGFFTFWIQFSPVCEKIHQVTYYLDAFATNVVLFGIMHLSTSLTKQLGFK
jgi:hypothetical protein